jgi:hypothetical protein
MEASATPVIPPKRRKNAKKEDKCTPEDWARAAQSFNSRELVERIFVNTHAFQVARLKSKGYESLCDQHQQADRIERATDTLLRIALTCDQGEKVGFMRRAFLTMLYKWRTKTAGKENADV